MNEIIGSQYCGVLGYGEDGNQWFLEQLRCITNIFTNKCANYIVALHINILLHSKIIHYESLFVSFAIYNLR